MTIRAVLQTATARLAIAGVPEADLDARLIMQHALQLDRSQWTLAQENEIDPGTVEPLLARRCLREPLAYILGYREFYGRGFAVGPGVLIPRQETETVVELAIALSNGRGMDIGTGSGCIGVTMKLEKPSLDVTLADISGQALAQATSNAESLGAEVDFFLGDPLTAYVGEPFDWLVSNPPYVEVGASLEPEVRSFEPSIALFAGGDGMDFYKRLAEQGRRLLKPGGCLVLELGDGQSPQVLTIFLANGWQETTRKSDLLGHVRALALRLKP